MNKLGIRLSLLVALVTILAVSCKPTEANYRAAYEATKAKTDEKPPLESTVYNDIRKQEIKSGLVVGNDTIPMLEVAVRCTPGVSTPDSVGKYSVAVAQFKQIFNARSMMSRLRAQGYTTATIVENKEPLYYVLISTFDNSAAAVQSYKNVLADPDVRCMRGYPRLFEPTVYPLR